MTVHRSAERSLPAGELMFDNWKKRSYRYKKKESSQHSNSIFEGAVFAESCSSFGFFASCYSVV